VYSVKQDIERLSQGLMDKIMQKLDGGATDK